MNANAVSKWLKEKQFCAVFEFYYLISIIWLGAASQNIRQKNFTWYKWTWLSYTLDRNRLSRKWKYHIIITPFGFFLHSLSSRLAWKKNLRLEHKRKWCQIRLFNTIQLDQVVQNFYQGINSFRKSHYVREVERW